MSKVNQLAHSLGGIQTEAIGQRAVVAVAAFLLGSFLLLATGFAGAEVIHNAAHDVRHAMSFPCH